MEIAVLEKPSSSADPAAKARTVNGKWVWECPDLAKLIGLRHLARELLSFDWCPVAVPNTSRRINTKTNAIELLDGDGFRAGFEFTRGFIGAITCTAADWLAHGDAIRAAHPVTKVVLTTWPDPVASEFNRERYYLFLEDRWPGVTFELPPA